MAQADGYELYLCPDCGSSLYDPASGCSHCRNEPRRAPPGTRAEVRYSFEASTIREADAEEWLRVMLYRSEGSTHQRENHVYRQLTATLEKTLTNADLPTEARQTLTLMAKLGGYAESQRETARADKQRRETERERVNAVRAAKPPTHLGLEDSGRVRCHLCGKLFPKNKFARHLKKRHSIVWNVGR